MDGHVRELVLKRTVCGRDIGVYVLSTDEGVHVSVFGGERTHIGAVSIVDPAGAQQDLQFPGHRDAAVASKYARTLSRAGIRPAVVEAGIHYDNITPETLTQTLGVTDTLLAELLAVMGVG